MELLLKLILLLKVGLNIYQKRKNFLAMLSFVGLGK